MLNIIQPWYSWIGENLWSIIEQFSLVVFEFLVVLNFVELEVSCFKNISKGVYSDLISNECRHNRPCRNLLHIFEILPTQTSNCSCKVNSVPPSNCIKLPSPVGISIPSLVIHSFSHNEFVILEHHSFQFNLIIIYINFNY